MKLPFFASLSAVVCGAAFGAAARWLLALWLDTPDQPFFPRHTVGQLDRRAAYRFGGRLGRQPAGPAAVLEIVADNWPARQPNHFFRFFTRNRCHAATTTLFRRRADHLAAPRRLAAFHCGRAVPRPPAPPPGRLKTTPCPHSVFCTCITKHLHLYSRTLLNTI